jgi:hypothetical protein
MPTNDAQLQTQARTVLDSIAFMPFEQCQPLRRGFERIPPHPGIYTIRHRTDGLLMLGKLRGLRSCTSCINRPEINFRANRSSPLKWTEALFQFS